MKRKVREVLGRAAAVAALANAIVATCSVCVWATPQKDNIPGNQTEKVSVAEAKARLDAHISHLTTRLEAMDGAYYLTRVADTLKANGIPRSSEYASNGLSLAWSDAKGFYSYHRDALSESRNALPATGYVSQNDLASLDQGVASWKGFDQQLDELFRELVSLYVRISAGYARKAAIQTEQSSTLSALFSRYRANEIDGNSYSKQVDAANRAAETAIAPIDAELRDFFETVSKDRDKIREIGAKRLFTAIKPWKSGNPRTISRTQPPAPVASTPKPATGTGTPADPKPPVAKEPRRGASPPKTTPKPPAKISQWRAVRLDTFPYGNDITRKDLLDRLVKAAAKLLNRAAPGAGTLAKTLPAAFSVTKAVDVYITYACVEVGTGKVLATRVVQLDDKDALSWWAKDRAAFEAKQLEAQRNNIILANRPRESCSGGR